MPAVVVIPLLRGRDSNINLASPSAPGPAMACPPGSCLWDEGRVGMRGHPRGQRGREGSWHCCCLGKCSPHGSLAGCRVPRTACCQCRAMSAGNLILQLSVMIPERDDGNENRCGAGMLHQSTKQNVKVPKQLGRALCCCYPFLLVFSCERKRQAFVLGFFCVLLCLM